MRHLELHIIQSVPVSCLNRDDLNSPKTAVFGGVQRARVSSQSWKRAIRKMAKEIAAAARKNDLFKGDRTRLMVSTLNKRLVERKIPGNAAVAIAEQVADIVETLDSKVDSDGYKKIKTLMFFSPAEYDAVVDAIVTSEDMKNSVDALEKVMTELKKEGIDKEKKEAAEKGKEEILKKMGKVLEKGAIAKAIKSAQLKDAADIALFGRMVANDHSLSVEAASMFSHALSTHKADNEIDFFAAVDDLQPKEDPGAGMTGTKEFNSATYYRFAALNLDMLADDDHLKSMTKNERETVVRTFIEATIKSVPTARKNADNGNTLPEYVLGIVREKGHPIQLVNAFESPVCPSTNGFVVESINKIDDEYADLEVTWSVKSVFAKAVVKRKLKDQVNDKIGSIKACSLDDLIDGMVKHVV